MHLQSSPLDRLSVLLAGDSGDGMQLAGRCLAWLAAAEGLACLARPDYPAEIRAPAGTPAGVSSYQVDMATRTILSVQDSTGCLLAMNPAALEKHGHSLTADSLVIVDSDSFSPAAMKKTDAAGNLLNRVPGICLPVPITSICMHTLDDSPLDRKSRLHCRNMLALGLLTKLLGFAPDRAHHWIRRHFAHQPDIAQASLDAFEAGITFEGLPSLTFKPGRPSHAPGTWRMLDGNEAVALGLLAAADRAGLPLFLGSYPITPASEILHHLAGARAWGVKTFQAEDELAAIGVAMGAAFAGALAATSTSGPGLSLKAESLGFAVMAELPLVVIDVQRAGPSTGMPTKSEQADLLQACFGRHGDCPLPVLAMSSPEDGFDMALEAARIALKYMTPVVLLSEAALGNCSVPFRVPVLAHLDRLITFRAKTGEAAFNPQTRVPDTGGRAWAIAGTPGLHHRIGGLERDALNHVSHDPDNHDKRRKIRAEKMSAIARDIAAPEIFNPNNSNWLALVTWGSGYGPGREAVQLALKEGLAVAHIHLRHLSPLPSGCQQTLDSFSNVLVAEANMGQLALILASETSSPVSACGNAHGLPLTADGLLAHIRRHKEKADVG
jgi:2-oxoglutarate ferredoxin oxidoreductase subunit alpha